MLEWFDWAGDYRWPVRMLIEGIAFFALPFAFVFSITGLQRWLAERRWRRIHDEEMAKARRAATAE